MGVTQAAGLSLRGFRDKFGAGPDDGRDPCERLSDEATYSSVMQKSYSACRRIYPALRGIAEFDSKS
jgi:hypothetical protein